MPSLSAEELKQKGNECFKEKRYHKAIAYYSDSLSSKVDSVVLSNRAQAYLSLKYHEAALTDASESIRLNPDFPKSYWRRAQALASLGLNSKARIDLKRVMELEPNNKAAQELLKRISISYDKPIVPIEVYDKNVYVRSSKPLQRIQIRDQIEPLQSSSALPASPVDTLRKVPPRSDTSSGVSTDDEPLPLAAETYSEFALAYANLKEEPLKFVQYLVTIPLASFERIFEPGIESEWVQTIILGLNEGFPVNDDVLQALFEITKAPRFEICVIFLSAKLKSDLSSALLKTANTSDSSLISTIEEKFRI